MNTTLRTIACFLLIFSVSASAGTAEAREWSFRVLLDGKPVGSQRFMLTTEAGVTRLETVADFKVKILFATVYRYLHRNEETWVGDCLAEINSSTDVNGKPFSVTGKKRDGYFEVTGTGSTEKLPQCISTFAYWDPDFLKHSRLLNAQNGEYLDVEVSDPKPDTRIVKGEEVPAMQYQLKAGELDLKLWYSTDDQWLALESKTRSDRILSYELL
jgi:hypothetical protein